MTAPRVSVAIATRDYGRYLPESLASVAAQTFRDFEVVVVDDGSTDDTPRVVADWSGRLPIRYVATSPVGVARAKSLAVGLCRGELVALLDADDVWLPTKLERQERLFRARPELGVVLTRRSLIDDAGRILPSQQPAFPRGRCLAEMFRANFICYSTAAVRRQVFEHVGRFDPRYDLAVDYDFWLRAARHYELDFIDERLVKYRTGHANLSRRSADRLRVVMAIMRRAEQELGHAAGVPAANRRRAWAETFASMAYATRTESALRAVGWQLRSLAAGPGGLRSAARALAAAAKYGLGGLRRPGRSPSGEAR